ncbi:MAG: winged helix-turn-helix domain-containing protein [Eubacterium sp.]
MSLIYIVEDDAHIREMESYALTSSGLNVIETADDSAFFNALKKRIPDLVVLDMILPSVDGMAILRRLRSNPVTMDTPVIIASAKSSELDKVRALDAGADDYITKPFGVLEFISRVKALLRRTSTPSSKSIYEYEGIVLDNISRNVSCNGVSCSLTYKEFELLKFLICNRGIVLTREQIINTIWGYDYDIESRTVDMHIRTLRKKLGASGRFICTVRNVGYKLEHDV